MTTTPTTTTPAERVGGAPAPSITDEELLARAAEVGAIAAREAAAHDAGGTFVVEGLEALRDAGLLAAAVPAELGGLGATIRRIALLQRELGHRCGSTALATAMHQHVVASTAWRHRRGAPGTEATLRRVAADGIVLISTGGNDFTRPSGEARRVDGGYVVSGRKRFASLSTHGHVLATMFPFEDPDQGRRVLSMAVPVSSPGVTVLGDWDALGMRGTASGGIVLEEVFVPDERVVADRPWGVIDPPLQVIGSIAMPIVASAYLGIAEAAYRAAVDAAAKRADDPIVQRQVGLMANRLRVAGWALAGALAEIGDDPPPSVEAFDTAMAAKREVALAAIEVCGLAMDVAGGSAFLSGSPIGRACRDVRGAPFHPLTPEQTLVHAGRLALGLPVDQGW